jgi:hypothetical protein
LPGASACKTRFLDARKRLFNDTNGTLRIKFIQNASRFVRVNYYYLRRLERLFHGNFSTATKSDGEYVISPASSEA